MSGIIERSPGCGPCSNTRLDPPGCALPVQRGQIHQWCWRRWRWVFTPQVEIHQQRGCPGSNPATTQASGVKCFRHRRDHAAAPAAKPKRPMVHQSGGRGAQDERHLDGSLTGDGPEPLGGALYNWVRPVRHRHPFQRITNRPADRLSDQAPSAQSMGLTTPALPRLRQEPAASSWQPALMPPRRFAPWCQITRLDRLARDGRMTPH